MKVSVVMTAYNSAASIGRAIESFMVQDYADRELIVVDGASKDETCRIVESFDSPLIRLSSEPDEGIYDAINKGIGRANGEVIGLLHSNDLFAYPGVLSEVAAPFAAPDLDAVYSDIVFFDEARPEVDTRRYRSSRFRPDRIAWGWMPAHTSLFMRRRVFETHGLYRTDYRIAGDFEYIARVFGGTGLKHAYFPEVRVRMQAGGASTGGLRSKMLLNKETLRACRENGIRTNYAMILSKYPMKIMEMLRT